MHKPKCILLMSGKRKCGKDFYAELLRKIYKNATIVRISDPVKGQYAQMHNLDHKELMTDGPYKELHRQAMIEWSDAKRAVQPGFFCRIACENAVASDVWIVSDIRRKTDLEWFSSHFKDADVVIKTVRISADDATRAKRGWRFTTGVDDVTSECDLDDCTAWDLVLANNNSSAESCNENIAKISKLIEYEFS